MENDKITQDYTICEASSQHFSELGKMMVTVYSQLPGFPDKNEMPEYYKTLKNIGNQVDNPGTELLVAVSTGNKLLGGVVYINDMKYYGSGGTANEVKNASGFRLLVVSESARGWGIGKALTQKCIEKAIKSGKSEIVIHTTKSMQQAWGMYERIGFKRSSDLDFLQQSLYVYGFRLKL